MKYFESQQDNEEVVLLVRKHWFMLLPSLLLVGVLFFIGFFSLFFFPIYWPAVTTGIAYDFFVISLSLLFLFTTDILFYVLLIYYLNVGIITNEHIVEIVQERLFSRKVSQLELGKIQDVAARQNGAMPTFLNYGSIEIQTAGELPNFVFKNIPRPNECAQKISQLAIQFGFRHGTRTEEGDVNANIVKGNLEKKESE